MLSTYNPQKIRHRKLEPFVKELRQKHEAGVSYAQLADEYNVAKTSVENVCRRISYPHIED